MPLEFSCSELLSDGRTAPTSQALRSAVIASVQSAAAIPEGENGEGAVGYYNHPHIHPIPRSRSLPRVAT